MILDVGCGAGRWLCDMAELGCVNLYGCDPFIEKDIKYPNGVKIRKCTIHEMEGKYDVIIFNDSLEHMSDPHEVFQTLTRLLKHKDAQVGPEAPKLQFILPIHPSISVDIYGMNSFALDAPRHYFLYTEKALTQMAEQYGFYLDSRVNRPLWGHLAISRAYQLGIKWTAFWPKFNNNEIWDDHDKQEDYFNAIVHCASLINHVDHAMLTFKRRED
jgi:SAM-dependent methyltransferase